MKNILFLILLSFLALSAKGQVYSIAQEPVCWTTPTEVDSSLNRYIMLSNLDNQPPRVLNYVNGSGAVVNVTGGGTIKPGYCGTIIASMLIDEIGVLQDSIIVLYADGVEINRDTVGPFSGGGGDPSGNGMFDTYNQDSLWLVTRYYLPGQHFGYMYDKAGWVLQDSSESKFKGENLISIYAASGEDNPPVIFMGSGNYIPQISLEGDTVTGGGRIVMGQGGVTYDLPIKDPDANGLPPGEYIATSTALGARGGDGGWTNIDSIRARGFLDTTIIAQDLAAGSVETLTANRQVNFTLALPDTSTMDRSFTLPDITNVENYRNYLYGDYEVGSDFVYKIVTTGNDVIRLGNTDRFTQTYLLNPGERVLVTNQNGIWHLSIYANALQKSLKDEFLNGSYIEETEFDFLGGTYSVQKSIPQGGVIDSVFVIQLNDGAPYGENMLYKSSNFADGSLINGWAGTAGIDNNAIINQILAPDGTFTADYYTMNIGSTFGVLSQRLTTNAAPVVAGDKLTFSFYAKSLHPDARFDISLSDAGAGFAAIGSVDPIVTGVNPTSEKFTRYSYTIDVVKDTVLELSIGIVHRLTIPNIAEVPLLALWAAQLERTQKVSPLKQTTSTQSLNNGKVIALLKLDDENIVDLEGVYNPEQNDDTFLRKAIDYCENTPGCQGVSLADGMTFTEGEILIPENFTLKGKGRRQTTVNIDLQDSTKSAFIFRDDVGAYVVGQQIKDFSVEVLDSCAIVFECRHVFDVLFEEVQVNGNLNVPYLIKIGETGQIGALTSTLRNCFLQQASEANILYERCGNLHKIQGGVSSRSFSAVACYTDIRSLTITDWDAENNNMAFNFGQGTGGRIAINGYFEQKTEAPERDFEFGSFESIAFRDCFLTMSDWGFGENPGAISFNGCSFNTAVNFESITNPGTGNFLDGPTFEPNSLSLKNCSFVRSANPEGLRAKFAHKWWFDMDGSVANDDGGNYGMITTPVNNLESKDSYLYESVLDNSFIGGEVRLSNLTFKGGDENLVRFSDSIPTTETSLVKIYPNQVQNPFTNEFSFDIITSKISDNANANLVNLLLSESILPGDNFTLSFYAKNLGSNNNGSLKIFGPESAPVMGIVSDEFKRYTIVCDSSSSTYSTYLLKYRGRVEGDSIAIGGFQINRGLKPLPLTHTNGVGASFTTTANIAGDVNFTGTLTASNLPTFLTATATLDFPSTSASAISDLTVSVAGAASGGRVIVGPPSAATTQGHYAAFVSAVDTVTVRFRNDGAGTYDPPSGTFTVTVIQQ